MQIVADELKILVRAEPRIKLCVVSGVVAVRIGFKNRRKVDGIRT